MDQHVRVLSGNDGKEDEDTLGVGASAFITAMICGFFLYVAMLFILQVAYQEWRREQISIRNKDDNREVRYKRRKREGLPDDFFKTYGYSYDWVFVFQVRDEWDELSDVQKQFSMKHVISALVNAGLDTAQYYSVQRDEVYCKIRCPLSKLVMQADATDYKMLLDMTAAREEMERGRIKKRVGSVATVAAGGKQPWQWRPRIIEDQFSQCKYDVYEYIYGKYESAPMAATDMRGSGARDGATGNPLNKGVIPQPTKILMPEQSMYPELYARYELENNVVSEFLSIHRIKIMKTIFEGDVSDHCCGLNLATLVSNDCILAAFPLHNPKEKSMLQKKWLKAHQWPWLQPIWDVKSYFGEKIGLYFAFIGHYCTWLIPAAIFGLGVYVDMAGESSYTVDTQFWFGLFLAFWSTFMLEFWKRQEVTYAMMWGMRGFEEEEEDRPEFQGEEISSPVSGEDETYFPESEVYHVYAMSASAILSVISVLIGVFASIFALRSFLNEDEDAREDLQTGAINFAQFIPSILCASLIMIGSHLFTGFAVQLTDKENHRTDTKYEDAMIMKTFIFEFFNCYSPCFYVLFLKNYMEDDVCVGGCMKELHYLLGCIFFLMIVVQNFLEIYSPIATANARMAEEKEGADPSKLVSDIEKQFVLQEHDAMFGSFTHYKEISIIFGYAVLFSVAFPLAPVLAFVTIYLEIRVDAWVLLQKSRRPDPFGAEDIGTWQSIFEILAATSIVSNMGIVFFTSESHREGSTWQMRIIYFLLCEHGIFMLQYLLAIIIDDMPQSTRIQLERQEFIADKLIDNLEDDIVAVDGEDSDSDEDDDVIDEIYDEDNDPML